MSEAKRIVESETWLSVGGCPIGGENPGAYVTTTDGECDLDDVRTRIAACAPEALRMLLAFEWCFVDRDMGATYLRCPSCGAIKVTPHERFCALESLFRKAGIR